MRRTSKIYTARQWEVTQDIKAKRPRLVILEGAVRSGKTYEGILYWNTIVSSHKGKLFIMTGKTISSLKRNVLDDIEKLFGVDTHLNINNEFEMYGNKVACFGTDKSDSYKVMRGLTAQGWYANEIILSHMNSILEGFARCSEDDAKIIWETNPDKPSHPIKKNYIDKSGSRFPDGKYEIMSYHFELDDNDRLEENYKHSLKNSIPKGTVYDRQIKGLWKAAERIIFEDYEIVQSAPAGHLIEDTCFAYDFGWNNPTALGRLDYVDNEIYVTGCYHKSKQTEKMIIENTERYVTDKRWPIYCDHKPDLVAALRNAGFNAINANKDVEAGIRKLKTYHFYIVDSDGDLVRSVENYEFQANAAGETLEIPVKYDDHYPDLIRYGCHSHNFSREKDSVMTGENNNEFEV